MPFLPRPTLLPYFEQRRVSSIHEIDDRHTTAFTIVQLVLLQKRTPRPCSRASDIPFARFAASTGTISSTWSTYSHLESARLPGGGNGRNFGCSGREKRPSLPDGLCQRLTRGRSFENRRPDKIGPQLTMGRRPLAEPPATLYFSAAIPLLSPRVSYFPAFPLLF